MRQFILLAGLTVLAGCSSTQPNAQKGPPVPTASPNAPHQEPAFPEQTRAPQSSTAFVLNRDTIAEGLEHPWGMAFLPDGRLLVTEKPGRLRLITRDGELSQPISSVPEVDSREQGGLLDVLLAKDFQDSRRLYFSFAEPRDDGETGTAIASARLADDEDRLENVEVIFRQQPSWDSAKHYGSRLLWDENGLLYVTLGERSDEEPRQLAQDLDAHLGKVIRIHPDGTIPEDNPFFDQDNAFPEIWSYGHRNIQGATIHPDTGELWVAEHGPNGGDELNRPEAGKNYGWPVITYGIDYSGEPIGDDITQKDGMEQPVYYWDPTIAPAGALFYQGDMFSQWQNNLFISSLKPGGLVRLELSDGRVTAEERLLKDIGRVRDIAEAEDGALWIITDEENGRLIRLSHRR